MERFFGFLSSIARWIFFAIAALVILGTLGAISGFFKEQDYSTATSKTSYQQPAPEQRPTAAPPVPTATPLPGYLVEATKTSLLNDATAQALSLDAQSKAIAATQAAINQQIAANNIDLQKKQADFIASEQTSNFWTWFLPVTLTVLVIACFISFFAFLLLINRRSKTNEYIARADADLIPLDALGNYFGRWNGNQIITASSGNAPAALPPTTLTFSPNQHYAPHLITKGAPERAAEDLPEATTKVIEGELVLPEKLDLYQALKLARPNPDNLELVIGQTAKGFIVRPFGAKTLHFGDVGANGSGKSSACQSDLVQLCMADPQARRVTLGFFDFEGKTSYPFRNALNTAFIAGDPEAAAAWLEQLETMMNERARMSDDELSQQMIWAIMLEEFLDIRDELDPESWQRVIRLARRGRKCNMFLMCANQTFYSDTDTRIIKGQLRTRLLFAVEDRGTGNAFGFRDNAIIDQLSNWGIPGRFATRDNGQLVIAQKPYIAPEQIEAFFEGAKRQNGDQKIITNQAFFAPTPPTSTNSQPLQTQVTTTSVKLQPETALSERHEVVKRLLKAQKSQSDIIAEVWGVKSKGGNAYITAAAELRQILAELL